VSVKKDASKMFIDSSMLGHPYKELVQRVRSAKSENFEIFTHKDNTTAYLVTSAQKKRSLLMRVVLPAARGELHDRIIASKVLRDDNGSRRIYPNSCWFQVAVESMGDDGVVVSFFLPYKAERMLPTIIVKDEIYEASDISCTATTVLCVINYNCRKALFFNAIYRLGCTYSVPFVCSFCGMVSDKKLMKCSGCWQTFYCGKECQKQHWMDEHRTKCGTCPVILVDQANAEEMRAMQAKIEAKNERQAEWEKRWESA